MYYDANSVIASFTEDVNVSTNDGFTSLILASMRGRTAIVRLLLDNGAKLDAKTDGGISVYVFKTFGTNPC